MEMREVSIGNKVKIKTSKEIIEGIILESHEQEIILVKLKSGYNIGIKKEDILDIEIIREKENTEKSRDFSVSSTSLNWKKIEENKEKKIEIKINKNLPNIDLIVTGGTISSKLDYKTGAVSWLTKPEELLEFYPELLSIVNIRQIKIPFMKASENMDSHDWKKIAEEAEKSLNDKDCKGIIITHGTDTLHYTSAALSFFLKNLNKPVVLTFSQRSSDRASSDARLNLICAAHAAISDIAEVMIVGHGSTNDEYCVALRGTKVRKLHSSKREAFKPVNCKPIAKIFPDKIETLSSYNKRDENKKVELDNKFNDKIALIKFYPGMEPEIFDYLSQRYEGIVIEVGGLGHIATDEARKNLIPAIKKAIDNGLVVCAACQTIYGRLNPLVYSPGRKLLKAGVIFLEDMLPETAFVKLGWVLGHSGWKARIREKMQENISGEMNARLEE